MPTSNSDAIAERPSLEQEIAKFKGFSTHDGEVANGASKSAADERAEAEAAEEHARQVNNRSHEDNQAAGTTSTEKGKETPAPAKVELTPFEEDEAIQAATDKKGEQLTDKEADEAVSKALAEKQKAERAAKKKEASRERYNENYRARRAAEREVENLRLRLEALERGEKPAALTNDKPADTKSAVGGKPDPTDTEKYPYGELDAKYLAELSAWAAREAIRQDREGEKTQAQQKQDAEAAAAFKETVAAFEEAGIEQFDDFHEVVMGNLANEKNPRGWPLSPDLGEMILESDHGPAIAYDLASNIGEARRVYSLSKAGQARWFANKEKELSAGSAASTDETTEEVVNPPPVEARRQRQLPQPSNSQVRESKAPQPLPSQRRVNGAGGNRMPSSATTDFRQFESMAMGGKR